MNITIITNVLPWKLTSGGAQAQFNMIDLLRKKHHFTVIFPEDFQNKRSALRELQQMWPDVNLVMYPAWRQIFYPRFVVDKVVRAFKKIFTPDSERFKVQRTLMHYGVYPSYDFMRFVNHIIREQHTDLIQVEFYPCLYLVHKLPKDIRKIFIHHELRFVKNQRMLAIYHPTPQELEWMHTTKREELNDLNQYDAIITLTQHDKDVLIGEGIKRPVCVSPAAVNTPCRTYKTWNHRLSFVGSYLHHPNQEGIEWYLREVIPLMKHDYPLDVIGKGWTGMTHSKNVSVMGFVADLTAVIRGSIMIVPILSGSGMRMKILEAAAMSMPIVTTSVGAEGLLFRNEESCLIADTPQDFAHAVERLAADEAFCRRLGECANQVFREHYSKEVLAEVRSQILLATACQA